MKSKIRYSTNAETPISLEKFVSSEQERNKLSNSALMLLHSNNLALANSNKVYKEKVIEFNNYLKDKDIHQITRVIRIILNK
ncbi:MAG TPA: hypothetical protein PKV40_06960 [Candidatus Kapabacteria bacterium]|nr:hypothetical protein [Candidatus Kapabacteria bacterium]